MVETTQFRKGVPFTNTELMLVERLHEDLQKKLTAMEGDAILPELFERAMLYMHEHSPKYQRRADLSSHDPHQGYIYTIRDPLLPLDANIIFVGSAHIPHTAVIKHIDNSHLRYMRNYWKDHAIKNPKLLYAVRGTEVYDMWDTYIKDFSKYPIPEGYTEIPWEIVDYQESVHSRTRPTIKANPNDSGPSQVLVGSLREYYADYYRAMGHPILNKKSGRPKGK